MESDIFGSLPLFKGKGWGWGTDLPTQNYPDI